MNLNDPDFQKQLGRWTDVTHSDSVSWSPTSSRWLDPDMRDVILSQMQQQAQASDFMASIIQPTYPRDMWQQFDDAFLKDLGIAPLGVE